eukprot:CAMPEP_0172508880 /NCGR_PEP_ID=MMETSP1066-20121228/215667_1 /TAXON_ID=671091 /ORGANISM="Coscinodiscus wailesii, Strain CCMP2513" /LENGTH=129 /DNA_ID=CAMNT_0013287089 /DNA_START=145 /DNA_END=534 /DNA_ORIENTATION=+
MGEPTFAHGDGWCCGGKCTEGEIGWGGCLMTSFFPCFAYCNAANDAKLDNGNLYCVLTFCGFGCCALMMLGKDVEAKRGLKKHDECWHCMQSTFSEFTCHSCRVVNECKLYTKDVAVDAAAPTGTKMVR